MTGRGWAEVMSWYRVNGQHQLPWREARSPWATLVAEYLLIRTRVSAVSRVYSGLLEAFPGPDRVVGDRPRWLDLTTSLGLPSRMHRFVETCEAVLGNHDLHLLRRAAGKRPPGRLDTLDELLSASPPCAVGP